MTRHRQVTSRKEAGLMSVYTARRTSAGLR